VESKQYQLTGLDCRVLITGGGSGFGLAAAALFAASGGRVVIIDSDSGKMGRALDSLGDSVTGIEADVTNSAGVDGAVVEAVRALSGLDVVINSAGICHYATVEATTDALWSSVLGVNLTGTFNVCRASAPFLAESGRGRIINMSSTAGLRGSAMLSAYVASKFGVIGLTQSLALELAPSGITANVVVPSSTPGTDMGRSLLEEKVALGWASTPEEMVQRTAEQAFPLGRVGEVSDITHAIAFLSSRESSFITGHSLVVDGGNSIAWPAISDAKTMVVREVATMKGGGRR
jgi:NAD(P)-dependent dehydrogenase (short-subunit alcohol dehydrogenase family)